MGDLRSEAKCANCNGHGYVPWSLWEKIVQTLSFGLLNPGLKRCSSCHGSGTDDHLESRLKTIEARLIQIEAKATR